MPAVSGTDEYVGTSILDASQLAGIDVTALNNGDLSFLTSTKKFYYLDKSSNATPDGVSVISTKSGVGRWIFGPVSNISVSTEAALALIGVTGLTDGTTAFHTGELSTWILVTKALTPVAQQVVATPDPNRFWVRETTTHDVWIRLWIAGGLNIKTPANGGNDQSGTGTAGAPLASWAEAKRRLGVGSGGPVLLSNTTSLDVLFGAGVYAEVLDLTGLLGGILLQGTETILDSGTLNAFVNINRASATGWATVGSAAFVFTGHVKRYLVTTSGAFIGARAVIESSPAANSAIISAPSTQADLHIATLVERVIAGTETFDIRVPGTFFTGFAASASDGSSSDFPSTSGTLAYALAFIGFNPTTSGIRLQGRCRAISSCKLDVKGDGAGGFSATALTLSIDGTATATGAALILGQVTPQDACFWGQNLCVNFGAMILSPRCVVSLGQDTMFSDATIFTNTANLRLGNILWHNTSASKHAIDSTAALDAGGANILFQAGGNIYGSLLGATSDFVKLGQFARVQASGVVSVIGFTGVYARFGSTTRSAAQLTGAGYFDALNGAITTENLAGWTP